MHGGAAKSAPSMHSWPEGFRGGFLRPRIIRRSGRSGGAVPLSMSHRILSWQLFDSPAGMLSAENNVGGMLGSLMFGDSIAERRQVDPGEHRFALPEHYRGQGEMQLVD
jgi:hypothetical protein